MRPRPAKPTPVSAPKTPASALDCAGILRALGDENRLRIVSVLFDQALSVNDIAARTGLSQYNASRHLKILRAAGVLEMEPDGQQRLYAVTPTLRGRVTTRRVLDLGCCEFRFPPAPSTRRPSRPPRPARGTGHMD